MPVKKATRRHHEKKLRQRRRQQLLIGGAAIAAIIGFTLIAVASLRPQPALAVDANDPAAVALGKQVYAAQCIACHGAELEGQPGWQERDESGVIKGPPHDETGHTWHHSDAYLIESIKRGGARLPADVGISPMPAYDDILSDAEIAAVLAFIKSEWPLEILEAQSQR